jgi:nitrite reductase/ring-hydroxylating ferredoxin subunit
MSGSDTDYVVASADELSAGDHLVVELEGREIGVFNVDGDYRAYTNWCAHHGGPVCEGDLDGTTEACFDRESLEMELDWVKEDRVLRCPWHAWEFDALTGDCLHDDRYRLAEHEARVEDGSLVVSL